MKTLKMPSSRLLTGLIIIAGLLGTNVAQAGQFGVTTVNPVGQTVSIGDSFSFDLTFLPGTLGTNGLKTPLTFDTSVVQYVSASSSYSGAVIDDSGSAGGAIGFELYPTGFSGGVNTLALFSASSSLALLASALVGLAAFRRRSSKA